MADGNTHLFTMHGHGSPEAIIVGLLGVIDAMHSEFRLLMLTIADRLRLVGVEADYELIRKRLAAAIDALRKNQAARGKGQRQ
jgi:hypothetical protein